MSGIGVAILSTPKGILTDRQARKMGVTGVPTFISSSAIGFYGERGDEVVGDDGHALLVGGNLGLEVGDLLGEFAYVRVFVGELGLQVDQFKLQLPQTGLTRVPRLGNAGQLGLQIAFALP